LFIIELCVYQLQPHAVKSPRLDKIISIPVNCTILKSYSLLLPIIHGFIVSCNPLHLTPCYYAGWLLHCFINYNKATNGGTIIIAVTAVTAVPNTSPFLAFCIILNLLTCFALFLNCRAITFVSSDLACRT